MSDRDSPALNADRPFPGLRPFAFADHQYFFGREDQSFALYRMLERSRFVAVLGSSGSGKSSLARAGLLPLLDEERANVGRPEGSRRSWRRTEFRPGDAPLSRLADALVELAGEDKDDPDADAIRAARHDRFESSLRQSRFALAEALRGMAGEENTAFFILVDQFEELFRYAGVRSERPGGAAGAGWGDEAALFVQLLIEAGRDRDNGVHIMITMRSDFIGDCSLFYGLPEAVSASQYLVPALIRSQREEAIRAPVEKAGAKIDSMLVERLLNDAGDELDQLPVLQHCLSRIWAHARRAQTAEAPVLVMGDYDAVGGIPQALSQHADDVMASVPGLELVVEQVFRALVAVDEDGRATRRALLFAQLLAETEAPEEDLRRVLDRFRADDCSFLVPSLAALPVLATNTTVDVGHEALLRRWERISRKPGETLGVTAEHGGWLASELEDGRVYRALVAWLDADDSGRAITLPLDQVELRWRWWQERRRTTAWAARYGGQLDRVRKLFSDSLAALKWKKWTKRVTAGVIAALVLIIVGNVSYSYLQIKHERDAATKARSEVNVERGMLLTEMTTMATQISGGLRFAPNTNKTIEDMLTNANSFVEQYKKTVKQFDESSEDTSVTLLGVTANILESDYTVNFGKFGEAIQQLDKAMDELEGISRGALGRMRRSLQIAEADVRIHRAGAEKLYQRPDKARDDLAKAEMLLVNVLAYRPNAAGNAADQEERLEERIEQAREKLAIVYRDRIDLELYYGGDVAVAASYFDTYWKFVANTQKELAADAGDAVKDFWAGEQTPLLQQKANLQAAQHHFDVALPIYDDLIAKFQVPAKKGNVMARLNRAFYEFRRAQALTQRAQGKDLEEARRGLEDGVDTYRNLEIDDPDNTWWWLVDAWVERALGDVMWKTGDAAGAKDAYEHSWQDDRHLQSLDKDNPRITEDLNTDLKNKKLVSPGD